MEEERSIEKPRKEVLKYLELRTKLKEVIRKKMRSPDQPVKSNHSLRFDDEYGSFFGPSQPFIAPRLLEENVLLLHKKSEVAVLKKSKTRTRASGSKPLVASADQKPSTSKILGARRKAQMLRAMRDYSFLLSDDNTSDQQACVSLKKTEAPTAQVRQKIMKKSSLPSNARRTEDDRKLAVADRQRQNSLATGKSVFTSQPAGMRPKGIPVPIQDRKEKNKAAINPSGSLKNHNGAKSTRLNPAAVSKQTSIKKGESQEINPCWQNKKQVAPFPSKGSVQPSSSKIKLPVNDVQQLKKQQIKNSKPEASSQLRSLKRKKPDSSSNARAISIMIRQMFGYDPSKYQDNGKDDKAMEATFADIQREERRSAKIARKEDQEELRKIVAEESKERLMKESAKKRKLTH